MSAVRLPVSVALSVLVSCVSTAFAPGPRPHIVASASAPELTLSIDPKFVELPILRFPIENLTDAERRIFVELGRGRIVTRMVIVQFEKVQRGSDFRFVYPSEPPRQFGAKTYRFGTFGYNDEEASQKEPLKEAGRTRAHLSSLGFAEARQYRVARLARVTDANGLSEVIIFYMENADRDGFQGPPDENGDWELSRQEALGLIARMEQAVRPLKG